MSPINFLKYMMVIKNRPSEMKFFGVKDFFFVNFDFNNVCKNEFEDNNEKSCSRFENRVPLKSDFRAEWTPESNPTAWELRWLISNSDVMIRFAPKVRACSTSNLRCDSAADFWLPSCYKILCLVSTIIYSIKNTKDISST